jgi:pyruvate formate lyase activating enzyme
VCQSDAIKLYGYEIDAEELAGILAKDRRFYRRSNGGVTVSGGEPTLQVSYLTKLLKSLRERGIHTAIETNGDFPAEVRDVLVSYVDQFLIDLKHMNAASHERATGRGNECIIQNLTALADKDTVIRIPLIPGFNDDEVNLKACAQFAASLGLPVHLLKFHAMAASKYETLGMNYAYAGRTSYSDDALDAIARIFAEEGVNACIGGGEEASPRPAFYRT